MPKCNSNIEPSECFAEKKIRGNLDQHPLYQPVVNETMAKLEVF